MIDARKAVVEDVRIQWVDQRGIALEEVMSFALRRNVLNTNGLGSAPPDWGLYITGIGNTYRGNSAKGNPGRRRTAAWYRNC